MPLITKVKVARLEQDCTADEAELLLEWLIKTPAGKLNLKYCTSLHTAVLQVMLACRAQISHLPEEPRLARFFGATRLSN
ncbi:hypothetical protein [Marinobacter sediminum]|uniref:hypothetical protein n=1 Tax=Marinobacter sediminum TaxID=256323 RepID=UPI00356A06A2